MSVLDEINARKVEHVAAKKDELPLAIIESRLKSAPELRGFIQVLESASGPAVIAEVKKASPSKGVIREDFDPEFIAKTYESAGASCISVLTDEPYFQGHDDYLKRVRASVGIPVLRKDFMIDPYQIYESRLLGADCILLIMASLSDSQAKELYDLSTSLGMDVLVEVHDRAELDRALLLEPKMVGINNRNLKNLEVNVQTSHDLVRFIPENVLKVAESGISSRETVQNLQKDGFKAFLIGESLMRQTDISAALRDLIA